MIEAHARNLLAPYLAQGGGDLIEHYSSPCPHWSLPTGSRYRPGNPTCSGTQRKIREGLGSL
jgi:hypothetical protein